MTKTQGLAKRHKIRTKFLMAQHLREERRLDLWMQLKRLIRNKDDKKLIELALCPKRSSGALDS